MRSLNLRFATLKHVTLQPNEDGGKAVLLINTPLTPQIAERLGIKEMCYQDNGLIRDKFMKIPLDIVSESFDAVVKIGTNEFCVEPQKARSFFVLRDESDQGTQLLLEFRVHMVGDRDIDCAYQIFVAANKDKFSFKLSTKQGELFANGDEAGEDEEDDEQPIAAESEGPALAPAALVGGTHAKRNRPRQANIPASEQDTSVLRGLSNREVQ